VEKNINNTADLDALIKEIYLKHLIQAIYAILCSRNVIARAPGCNGKAYDPEVVVSGSEEMRRALNKFYNFVEEEVREIMLYCNQKQAEYEAYLLKNKLQLVSLLRDFVLHELSKLISDPRQVKLEQRLTDLERSMNNFDHMARASSMKLIGRKNFKTKTGRFDRRRNEHRISSQVYDEPNTVQDTANVYRSLSRQEPLIIRNSNHDTLWHQMLKAQNTKRYDRELWRIGRQRGNAETKDAKRYSSRCKIPRRTIQSVQRPFMGC